MWLVLATAANCAHVQLTYRAYASADDGAPPTACACGAGAVLTLAGRAGACLPLSAALGGGSYRFELANTTLSCYKLLA